MKMINIRKGKDKIIISQGGRQLADIMIANSSQQNQANLSFKIDEPTLKIERVTKK